MSKPKAAEGPLVTTALALESGLVKWEALVAEALRVEASSDKTLGRAKKILEECAASEHELAKQLHAFVSAMQAVQERQRACMEKTVEAARRLQERVASRQALLERFAELGQRAGEINAPVATVMDAIGRGAPPQELLAPLDDVEAKTAAVVAGAEAVANDAREQGWEDVAREAESLRQQIHVLRKKINDAHRSVASRSPS